MAGSPGLVTYLVTDTGMDGPPFGIGEMCSCLSSRKQKDAGLQAMGGPLSGHGDFREWRLARHCLEVDF